MIVFRQTDPRYPFLWSGDDQQPPGRWHGEGEGPAHYFADSPAGAWAELLRHEEITDLEDLATIRRAMWAVEISDEPTEHAALPAAVMLGDHESYERCQKHAREMRNRGVRRIIAPSAALKPGGAAGSIVANGRERTADPRDGRTIVSFGSPDGIVGWQVVEQGAPPASVLMHVRHFGRRSH